MIKVNFLMHIDQLKKIFNFGRCSVTIVPVASLNQLHISMELYFYQILKQFYNKLDK